MAPPRLQGVDAPRGPFPISAGGARLDESARQDILDRFQDAFLPSLTRLDSARAWERGSRLFRDGEFQLQLKFHRTTLPVENSPDLKVLEGAALCAGLRTQDGKLTSPGPVGLSGFVALGGLLDFCFVEADPAGRLILRECPCAWPRSEDITEPILQSPLGALFPSGRAQPVPLVDLRKLLEAPPAGPSASGDGLLQALHHATLRAKIPSDIWVDDPPGTPGGSCHPLLASLELYLDLSRLRDNMAAGLWRHFDAAGVEAGSYVDWPRLKLSDLPLPEGIRIPEGRADLRVDFHPDRGETEIRLKALDARIQLPALFGEAVLRARGELAVRLKRGGEAVVDFRGLDLEIPGVPPGAVGAPSLSLTLAGEIRLHQDVAGLSLRKAKLELREIRLKTPPGGGLRLAAGGAVWSPDLGANLEIDYDAGAPETPLRVSGELEGALRAEAGGVRFEVQKLHAVWSGPFAATASGLRPKLESWDLRVGGRLSVHGGEGAPGFVLEGGELLWMGDGAKARLELDAKALRLGPLEVKPELRLDLRPPTEPLAKAWAGTGEWRLRGEAPSWDLGSEIQLSTDLENSEWSLRSLRADRSGRLLIRDGKVSGRYGAKGFWALVEVPRVPGASGLSLSIRQPPGAEHFTGVFRLRPEGLALAPELSLKDVELQSTYQTPPWREFLAKPRVTLDASASGLLSGAARGPLSGRLRGSLTYSSDKNSLFLWINPKSAAPLRAGPLELPDLPGKALLEGRLAGTWQVVFTPHGPLVGGRGVGIRDGRLSLEAGGDAQPIPLLSGLSILADQLWSIQAGVAYAGGDGIKFESEVHAGALTPGLPPEAGRRRVVWIVDQLPLSLAAYWKLFAKSLREEGGK